VLDGGEEDGFSNDKGPLRQGLRPRDPSTDGFAEAVKNCKESEVAILVVGDKSDLTSGREPRPRAPEPAGVQEKLVKAVGETGDIEKF